MFFSTYVLTKKGPLAKIWLAAHWDKKLTQKDVKVVDLNDSVVQIVQPAVPIALRTSGELMLGVVRIYALKVTALLKDATEVTITLRPRNVQVVKGAPGKEGATGITMDLVVGRVGAEQLCEADFNDIADILAPHKQGKRGHMAEAEVIGQAWLPVENTQLEEMTALGDAELARVRQDLLATFGAPRDGSSTTTSKSVEHQRAAATGAVDVLDIGMPAPDLDLNLDMPLEGFPPLGDPFGFGALETPAKPAGEEYQRPARKIKAMQLLDTGDTVMSKEAMQRNAQDRHDIVNAERRHGALNDDEARDRHVLRAENPLAACDTALPVPNDVLRGVFEKALRSSNAAALEKIERGRGLAQTAEKAGEAVAPAYEDLPPFEQPAMDPWYQAEVPEAPELAPASTRASGKRPRPEEDKFSAHTLETLARVKQQLGTKTGATVKFAALTKNESRTTSARVFVDVLALASHNFVAVSQAAPYAELNISAGPKLLAATA
jgi:cohesin complex subunit SCC1